MRGGAAVAEAVAAGWAARPRSPQRRHQDDTLGEARSKTDLARGNANQRVSAPRPIRR